MSRTHIKHLVLLFATLLLAAPAWARSSVRTLAAGSHADSIPALYQLSNGRGMSVRVTDFAATLTDVVVPDRLGNPGHVVLGFDNPSAYLGRHPKFGATVGRYANRIANATFTLDGTDYQLEKNSRQHSIHGGSQGFYRRFFTTDSIYTSGDTAVVVFSCCSADGEGGFPGNLHLRLAYKLTPANELILDYTATTDRPTVINLTNHAYFNLSGCRKPVLDHLYMINADSVTPTDSSGIPTGAITPVQGTVYDFTSPRTAAAQISSMGRGYDINYCLNGNGNGCRHAATVVDPTSGRALAAYTTEPGMQFYIPHSDMRKYVGHLGRPYGRYFAFCLEMQHFPDSPNHPGFPSTVLRPGHTYRQITIYKFYTIQE